MWEKLLGLFKETYSDDKNYKPASLVKREQRRQELVSQPLIEQTSEQPQSLDKGKLIGFNYLKGLEDEKNNDSGRRFINLTKLLRGDYKNEQTPETSEQQERDIRRKNS